MPRSNRMTATFGEGWRKAACHSRELGIMYSAYNFDFNGDFAHSKPRNQHAKGLRHGLIKKQEDDRWTHKIVMPKANQNSCDEMSWSPSERHVLVLISYVFLRMTKTHVA